MSAMLAGALATSALFSAGAPDWCAWREPRSSSRQTRLSVEKGDLVEYRAGYAVLWALCGQQTNAPPVRATLSVDRGFGWKEELSEEVKIHAGPDPYGESSFDVRKSICGDEPVRGKKTLRGPAGEERWHVPVHVRVDVDASGPYAKLKDSRTTTVWCPVCPPVKANVSVYQDYGKDVIKIVAVIGEETLKCAGDDPAHRLDLRLFAGATADEVDKALVPTMEWKDLQTKVKPKQGKTGERWFETAYPVRQICALGAEIRYEVAGIGEYFGRSYQRWRIDPMRCP